MQTKPETSYKIISVRELLEKLNIDNFICLRFGSTVIYDKDMELVFEITLSHK